MGNFTSTGWIIFIAFMAMLPPTIAALASFRQTRIIHTLVNSQLTSVKAELTMANDKIAKLEKFIVNQDTTQKPNKES